ncbi:flippase-like domain-containing protein [Candidatus Micrarchaeota archaeon]|nr:flippase-like domain-containing protein [Candidatus Micrarchaeota archaeon]
MKLSNLALAAVSILLIAFLLSTVDIPQLARTLSGASLPLVVAALLSALTALAFKTLRWKALLSEKREIKFGELFPIQVAGIATSNFSPGKMLEPVKVVPLKQRGINYSFGLLTVFWERAFDLLVLFALAIGALPLLDGNVRLALSAIFLIIVLAVLAMFRHFSKILSLLKRLPFLKFLSGVEAHNFKKRALLSSFGLTAVAWIFDALVMQLSFMSVGISISFTTLASAYFASILIGVVSFLPGGIGGTEAAMLFLLKGAAPKEALLGAIVIGRASSLGFSSLLGFAMLPKVRKN